MDTKNSTGLEYLSFGCLCE